MHAALMKGMNGVAVPLSNTDTQASLPEMATELQDGEFLVDICKNSDGLGLEIESINGMLLVAKLKQGPMTAWNATNVGDPDLVVRAGDRIISVNGTRGDSTVLIDELKRDSRLRLLMRHAREFRVDIDKAGRDLGICVISGNVKLDMLKISGLRSGVVEDWGLANPGSEVLVGDRIIEVNGISNDPPNMLEELRANSKLAMVVIRPA